MISDEELANLLGARYCSYQVLHSIFGVEPSASRAESLRDSLFHDAFEAVFAYAATTDDWQDLVGSVLDAPFDETRTDDYTRAFVGPGTVVAPPWESVYVNPQPLLFQENTIEARKKYLAHGFIPKQYPHVPDDQLAVELDFMEQLARQACEAHANGDDGERAELVRASAEFIDEHLGRWVEPFAERLSAGQEGFYSCVAKLLVHFVHADRACLKAQGA